MQKVHCISRQKKKKEFIKFSELFLQNIFSWLTYKNFIFVYKKGFQKARVDQLWESGYEKKWRGKIFSPGGKNNFLLCGFANFWVTRVNASIRPIKNSLFLEEVPRQSFFGFWCRNSYIFSGEIYGKIICANLIELIQIYRTMHSVDISFKSL